MKERDEPAARAIDSASTGAAGCGVDANIRAPSYLLAQTQAPCRHCGSATTVYALALPPAHEVLAPGADGAPDQWQSPCGNAFLFHIAALPPALGRRLLELAPGFRPAAAAAGAWANHCEHCGAQIDDDELHEEPGIFVPFREADAGRIELLIVAEAFEAAADGYAPDPEFFAMMPVCKWPSIS